MGEDVAKSTTISINEWRASLDVSLGSITGWKQAYEEHGIDGLRLNHKGFPINF
jgi:transposase